MKVPQLKILFSHYVIERIREGEFEAQPYNSWSKPGYMPRERSENYDTDDWYLRYDGLIWKVPHLYRAGVKINLSIEEQDALNKARRLFREAKDKRAEAARWWP